MLIDESEMPSYIHGCLEAIAQQSMPTHTLVCDCGRVIRFPIIARKRDIEDFMHLMQTAMRVMDEYGITGNILAEIKTQCYIELAKRGTKK